MEMLVDFSIAFCALICIAALLTFFQASIKILILTRFFLVFFVEHWRYAFLLSFFTLLNWPPGTEDQLSFFNICSACAFEQIFTAIKLSRSQNCFRCAASQGRGADYFSVILFPYTLQQFQLTATIAYFLFIEFIDFIFVFDLGQFCRDELLKRDGHEPIGISMCECQYFRCQWRKFALRNRFCWEMIWPLLQRKTLDGFHFNKNFSSLSPQLKVLSAKEHNPKQNSPKKFSPIFQQHRTLSGQQLENHIRILQNIMRLKSKSVQITHKKREWSKVIAPLLKYTRTSSTLGNPIDFCYHLQQMIKQGQTLSLNIPHTLTGAHDNCLMTDFENEQQRVGHIVFKQNISKSKFSRTILGYEREKAKNKNTLQGGNITQNEDSLNSKSHWLPFVVIKEKNNEESSTFIWNIHEYEKVNTLDANQIAQSYIFTKNPQFISIIRFIYTPNKKNQSFAYSIENIQKVSQSKMNKSQWKVIQHSEKSCFFLKIMYENKLFYQQTLDLIGNLEKFMNRHVLKIATDWVVDACGRYYLVDVKEVMISEEKKLNKCRTGSVNELLSVVSCSMCLQSFHPSEITKVLTNNLIEKFDKHLKQRQISLSFKVNRRKIIDFSKVCNLCYCLVVKQHELIELEKVMGQICHNLSLPISKDRKKVELALPLTSNQKKIHPSRMYQWRLLIFIEELKNCDYVLTAETSKTLYLHLKINSSVTTLTIEKKKYLQVRAIKLQYLFSEKMEIYEFFRKIGISVELSNNKNWGNPLAQGCIHMLYDQQEIRSQAIFQRKSKEILLFTNSAQYSTLGICIGLIRDKIKDTRSLNLEKIADVYKCSNQYIDCREFPPEWLEIVDPTYERSPSQIFKEEENEIVESIIKKLRKTESLKSNRSTIKEGETSTLVQNIESADHKPLSYKYERNKSKSYLPQVEQKNKVRKKLQL